MLLTYGHLDSAWAHRLVHPIFIWFLWPIYSLLKVRICLLVHLLVLHSRATLNNLIWTPNTNLALHIFFFHVFKDSFQAFKLWFFLHFLVKHVGFIQLSSYIQQNFHFQDNFSQFAYNLLKSIGQSEYNIPVWDM